MSKVTLSTVSELQAFPTAAANINSNSAALTTAIEKTLSRDGTSPNQMEATLDMNSQQIINLPAPSTGTSPLRLTDASLLNGGGTIATVPAGGTTGQAIIKASNTDFDLTYGNIVSSVDVTMPAGITVTGSPVTSSGTIAGNWTSGTTGSGANVFATSPALVTPNLGTPSAINLVNATGMTVGGIAGLGTGMATFLGTPTSANLAATLTDETGTGANVFGTSPTITSPVLVTPALGTPASGTLTNCTGLPVTTGVSGLAANVATFLATPSSANLIAAMTDETGTGANVFATSPTLVTPILGTPTSGTLTNCTIPVTQITGFGAGGATFLATPSSANLASFLTDETGSGSAVFGTSPTVTTPNIVGTTAVGNASAGSVGEYVSSIIASGSAVSMSTGTGVNVTSISLTAGDWDVWGTVIFTSAATTNITQLIGGTSSTSATLALVGDKVGIIAYGSGGVVPGVLHCGSCSFQTRFNVSATTTIYLIGQPSFTVAALTAWGSIQARRVR